MSLRTAMARDLGRVFLRVADFAESGTYQPIDAASGFALVVVPGEDQPGLDPGDGGLMQASRITVVAALADFAAGMTGLSKAGQNPVRGDSLIFASPSALAGTWKIDGWATDVGGALTLACVRSDWFTVGTSTAREV